MRNIDLPAGGCMLLLRFTVLPAPEAIIVKFMPENSHFVVEFISVIEQNLRALKETEKLFDSPPLM